MADKSARRAPGARCEDCSRRHRRCTHNLPPPAADQPSESRTPLIKRRRSARSDSSDSDYEPSPKHAQTRRLRRGREKKPATRPRLESLETQSRQSDQLEPESDDEWEDDQGSDTAETSVSQEASRSETLERAPDASGRTAELRDKEPAANYNTFDGADARQKEYWRKQGPAFPGYPHATAVAVRAEAAYGETIQPWLSKGSGKKDTLQKEAHASGKQEHLQAPEAPLGLPNMAHKAINSTAESRPGSQNGSLAWDMQLAGKEEELAQGRREKEDLQRQLDEMKAPSPDIVRLRDQLNDLQSQLAAERDVADTAKKEAQAQEGKLDRQRKQLSALDKKAKETNRLLKTSGVQTVAEACELVVQKDRIIVEKDRAINERSAVLAKKDRTIQYQSIQKESLKFARLMMGDMAVRAHREAQDMEIKLKITERNLYDTRSRLMRRAGYIAQLKQDYRHRKVPVPKPKEACVFNGWQMRNLFKRRWKPFVKNRSICKTSIRC